MKLSLNNLFVATFVAAFCVSAPDMFADTKKWIELRNTTSTAITNVFFSEIWSRDWGGDALEGTIGQGATKTVAVLSAACMIDMQVRYVNDVRHDLRFDICRAELVDATSAGLNVTR
jgi:hypothetical protein